MYHLSSFKLSNWGHSIVRAVLSLTPALCDLKKRLEYYKMITPFFFFENRSGSEIWDPRSFKTPFCIANYIGEAINGCNFIHQDDAFPFIQYFIEFCSSEGSEEILSIYAKNFKKKPYWKLSDAKNRMRAYQNSLMITNFISCRKTWKKRLEYYKIFIKLFFFECEKCQSNLSS